MTFDYFHSRSSSPAVCRDWPYEDEKPVRKWGFGLKGRQPKGHKWEKEKAVRYLLKCMHADHGEREMLGGAGRPKS